LVDFIALLGAGKNAGAAQSVDRRMVGVLGINVPFVFPDLARDPFLSAATQLLAFWSIRRPVAPARAQADFPSPGIVFDHRHRSQSAAAGDTYQEAEAVTGLQPIRNNL
jgi:hypothetical protein